MPMNKKNLYAELLDRQSAAVDAGYHYEACWFIYAIFEDRSRSIVKNSGDGHNYGGFISEKLTLILKRHEQRVAKVVNGKTVKNKISGNKEKKPKWPHLHTVERALIVNIEKWIKCRNELVHRLALGKLSLQDADVLSARLSKIGLRLAKRLCTAARRVKKLRKKQRKKHI